MNARLRRNSRIAPLSSASRRTPRSAPTEPLAPNELLLQHQIHDRYLAHFRPKVAVAQLSGPPKPLASQFERSQFLQPKNNIPTVPCRVRITIRQQPIINVRAQRQRHVKSRSDHRSD